MIDDHEILVELRGAIRAIAHLAEKVDDESGRRLGSDDETGAIDPERTSIAGQLRAARDFAWAPDREMAAMFDAADLQDVICFVEGLPPIDGEGEIVVRDYLRQVRLAADARAHILHLEAPGEAGDFEGFGNQLTLPMIAALGWVTERSVRNAVSRGELTPVGGSGTEAYYSPADAYRWLLHRRGFVPWPASDQRRNRLYEALLRTPSRAEFAEVVRQLTKDIDDTAAIPGFRSLEQGDFQADVALLKRAAEVLGVPDRPAFVGHGVMLAMREQEADHV